MSQPIGILSDTHDQVHHLPAVIEFYNQQNIRSLIHCGDWISPFVLGYFSKLNAPIYGVFGNNDGDKFLHARVAGNVGLDITMEDQLLTLEVGDRNLAVYRQYCLYHPGGHAHQRRGDL